MTNQGTMLWAGDGTPARELVEATARDLGLAVCFCALQELGDSSRASQSDVIAIETGADPARALALVAEVHGRLPQATILLASPDGSVGFHPAGAPGGCERRALAAASAERAAQGAHPLRPRRTPDGRNGGIGR